MIVELVKDGRCLGFWPEEKGRAFAAEIGAEVRPRNGLTFYRAYKEVRAHNRAYDAAHAPARDQMRSTRGPDPVEHDNSEAAITAAA